MIFEEGAVSEKDIKAPFQIKDEKATRQAEEDAADKIDVIYSIVPLAQRNAGRADFCPY